MLSVFINVDHFKLHKEGNTKMKLLVWMVPFLFHIVFLQAGVAAESLTDAARKQKIDELYGNYKREFPNVADFSADQTMKLMDRIKIILVDIREPEEREVSMIPGAIMEREFFNNSSAYQNNIVVAYCTIGSRSDKLAKKFKKKGISMFNLSGGILAWLHAGGIVHKDGKPVKRVHVYSKKWDLAPAAIESVW